MSKLRVSRREEMHGRITKKKKKRKKRKKDSSSTWWRRVIPRLFPYRVEIKRLRKTSPPRLLVTRTSRFINFFLLPTINTCVFVFIELSFHFHFDGYFSPCFSTPLREVSSSVHQELTWRFIFDVLQFFNVVKLKQDFNDSSLFFFLFWSITYFLI